MTAGGRAKALEGCLTVLARDGSVPLAAWPGGEDPADFGLLVDAGQVVPAVAYDPLEADTIRAALSPQAADWLRRLEVLPVTGSTNSRLMARAGREPINGSLCTAELQLQGRGRRGRSWISPFGASLAISIGIAVAGPPSRLGGVSLVVGLAVLDALETAGGVGLGLKWPNDVLLGDAKVGGILIEVSQQRRLELVIGVGLNVELPAALHASVPASVADLARAGIRAPRSETTAAVVSRVIEFIREFERSGFEVFQAAFDARHAYHGQRCDVLVGDGRVSGTVIGVSAAGELMLHTEAGERRFHAGEVSLRHTA